MTEQLDGELYHAVRRAVDDLRSGKHAVAVAADLEAALEKYTSKSVLRPCVECGFLLFAGDNVELSDGTYCEDCAAHRDEGPPVTDGGVDQSGYDLDGSIVHDPNTAFWIYVAASIGWIGVMIAL